MFKVGYGVRMLAPFTTDTVRLHSAIEAATFGDADKLADFPPLAALPPPSLPLVAPAYSRPPDLGPVAAGAVGSEVLTQARTVEGLDSLYTLLGIAQALSAVEGRKSVVYFAEAWHLPARTQHVYDDAVSAANRANVAVHTVDVRGLTSRKPRALTVVDSVLETFSASHGGRASTGAVTPPPAEAGGGLETGGMALRGMEAREELLSAPRLERLAEDTGGLAIQNTNDLGYGLTRVAQELGHYYEVVYAPANPVADGRFRRIGVKTSRRGVRLRTRVGYFATPGRSAAVRAYELPLLDALAASPGAQDFTLRTGLLHFAPKDAERKCLVLAEVPLSEVHIASDEARGVYRAHLAFLGHIRDEAGRAVARITHDWSIEGPLNEKESARYNIGPRRTVNVPTMALLFLHPRNQSRFSFKKGGSRRFEGFEGLEIEFEEVQRPTLTRDSEGRSVPVNGRFWIDASRGTVLRSEARYRAGRAEGFITVEYRRERRLAMWVPDEMGERYRNLPSSQEPAPRDSAEAMARYSNYRQFKVSVEATVSALEP